MSSLVYSRKLFETSLHNELNNGKLLFGGLFNYEDENGVISKFGVASNPWAITLGVGSSPNGVAFNSILSGDPVIDYSLDSQVNLGTLDVVIPDYPAVNLTDHTKYNFETKGFEVFLAFDRNNHYSTIWSLTPVIYNSVVDHVRKISNNTFRFYLNVHGSVNVDNAFSASTTLDETTVADRINTVGLGLGVAPLFSNISSNAQAIEPFNATTFEDGDKRWEAIEELIADYMGPEIYLKEGSFNQYVIYTPDLTKPTVMLTDNDIDSDTSFETIETIGPYHRVEFKQIDGDQSIVPANTNVVKYGAAEPRVLSVDQRVFADTVSQSVYRSNYVEYAKRVHDTIRIKFRGFLPIEPGTVVSVDSVNDKFVGYCVRCKFTPTKTYSIIDLRVRRSDDFKTNNVAVALTEHSVPTVPTPSGTYDSETFNLVFTDTNPPHGRNYWATIDGVLSKNIEQNSTGASAIIDISNAPSPATMRVGYNDDMWATHNVQTQILTINHA